MPDSTVWFGGMWDDATSRVWEADGTWGPDVGAPAGDPNTGVGATLASETWTGADGAAWPSQWINDSAGASLDAGAVRDIQGNRGRLQPPATSWAGGCRAYLNGMTAAADVDLIVDVLAASPPNAYALIAVRTNGTPEDHLNPRNGYFLVFGEGNATMRRSVNGSRTSLHSVPWALSATVPTRVRLRAYGSRLSFKLWAEGDAEPADWTWSGDDTGITAAGKAWLSAGNGGTATSVTFDNLAVREAVAGQTVIDSTAPSAPTGVTATANSTSQITVGWIASTDNVGVAGYRIKRGGAVIATGVTGTTYVDSGLAASTAYSYTVAARDAAGNYSAESAAATATTQAPAPAPTTITFVQEAIAQPAPATSTSIAATFPAAPTAGRLLVAALAVDKGDGAATIPGWTEIHDHSGASVSHAMWWKVADGSETTVTATWEWSSLSGGTLWVGEYQGPTSWALLGSAANSNTDDATSSSRSTGTTAAIARDGLAVAYLVQDSVASWTPTATNGFAARFLSTPRSAPGELAVFTATVTAGATVGTTISTGAPADQQSAAVAVFGSAS